ncbi:Cof-type HAD-IIB family hydrolase [Streptococcus dentasini]
MIKLIAIDLDGTLLNSQKKIPTDNIEAVRKAADAGVKIVLCTGRPKSGVLPYFNQLGLAGEEYIIMNNGCTVYNTQNWELIGQVSLNREDLSLLEKACADDPDVYLTLTAEATYYAVAERVPALVAYDAGLVFDTAQAASLDDVAASGQIVFQAMYMGEEEALNSFESRVEHKLSQRFSTVRSQSYIYEVMPSETTKASALKALAQQLNIQTNEIMALGDAANDMEMLEFAGHSVAMGNAPDTIKARCRYETESNDNAGVAKAIYEYVLD